MIAQRRLDSQRLTGSRLTMQVTIHVASSGSARSDRRGRGETPYQRRGVVAAVSHRRGWGERLTGSVRLHRVTGSQGVAAHSGRA